MGKGPAGEGEEGGTAGEEESRGTHGVVDSLESLESYSGEHNVVEHSPHGRYVRFNVKMGSGNYKEMWRAYDTSEGVEVSWNTLSLKMIPPQDKRRVISELKILEELDHPNIISFYTSWYNREQKQIVFITELISSGSLMDFVKPITLRWKIFKNNIYILGNRGQLKIGDLGLSTASHNRSENVVGNPHFMAPELFEDDYDEKVDIYAFGMCILQIITKEVPYSECQNIGEVCRRVMAHVPPAALSRIQNENAAKFIELCLQADPKKRPSADELLRHPFLQENKEEDASEVILGPRVEVPIEKLEGLEASMQPRSRVASRSTLEPVAIGADSAGNAPIKSLGTVIGPDGTKLHMRFFSEPHGSYSEYSDDESDIEGLFELPHSVLADMPRDDSLVGLRSRGASGASMESMDDIRGMTRVRSMNSIGSVHSVSTVASRSPKSAWNKEDDRTEDDDLLSYLPAAENTCKKVKVMGGRNAELVEDDVPSKDKGTSSAAMSTPAEVNTPSRSSTPEPFVSSSQPAVKEKSPVKDNVPDGVAAPSQQSETAKVEERRASLPPEPIKEEDEEEEEDRSSETSKVTKSESTEEGENKDQPLPNLPSYDISVLSSSSSSYSVSSSGSESPPPSPDKSVSNSPPDSPASAAHAAGKRANSNASVIRVDTFDDGARDRARSNSSQQSEYSCILDTSETLDMDNLVSLPPPPALSESHTTSGSRASKQAVMTLIIKTPVEGRLKEVQFDFNLESDDALAVAKEMVTELGIPETDMPGIAKTITALKEKEQARRLAKQRRKREVGEAEGPPGVVSPKNASAALAVTVPSLPRPPTTIATPPAIQPPITPGAASKQPVNRPIPANQALVHQRTASGARLQRLPSEKQLIHSYLPPGHATASTTSTSTTIPSQQAPVSANPAAAPTGHGLLSRGHSNESLVGVGGASRRPSAASSTSNPADEEMDLLSTVESDDSSDEDDERDFDLQKKKQEHVKIVQRARKAFAARMESMVKHREDKDRSHRELLEQLDREIAECDRRVLMAEEDQHRRLKEMEDAWRAIEERHRQLVRLKQLQKQQQQQQQH